jgi:glyoxylase-like metal-dependent hydrolase (beta-lactamase superfamily II)
MEIGRGIFFVRGNQRGKFPFSNSLIVKHKVMLDVGCGIEIVKDLSDKVEFAALTHTHPDHCAGAWVFNEKSKRVLSPAGYETKLESLANRFVDESLKKKWKSFVTKNMGLRDSKVEHYSNEDVILKEPEIVAIYTPGHTADMHIFYIDGRTIFGSDIDLTSFGPWYGHRESSIKEFFKSIEKVMSLDAEIFVSGHEEPVFGRENIVEKLQSYLDVFEKRNEILLEILEKASSLEELIEISPFYKKKPYEKELLDYWEGQMIKKHLNLLIDDGEVVKDGEKFLRI